MEKSLFTYVDETSDAFCLLLKQYAGYTSQIEIAMNLLNCAISMRNADCMNQNITANMNIMGGENNG